jgi:hypothetical protein
MVYHMYQRNVASIKADHTRYFQCTNNVIGSIFEEVQNRCDIIITKEKMGALHYTLHELQHRLTLNDYIVFVGCFLVFPLCVLLICKPQIKETHKHLPYLKGL